ncbi:RNA polymerase sigma factor [Nocardia asiatica]|uniref:RNA polymerase sigma factor n=1 Tax=Nocardia asiatica TaxID=209252 RepID=UPI002455A795|nr:sigma-70 family RNA polymerase sigma factor [Nocardia asiatica]
MTRWETQPWAAEIEGLYKQNAQQVYRLAYLGLRGDAAAAEDVVQDVFLAVCQLYPARFLTESSHRQTALIITIAKRRLIDRWRKKMRSPESLVDDLEVIDRALAVHIPVAPTSRAERTTEDNQLRQLWEAVTRDLTPHEAQTAFMTWMLGMSANDIARELDITTKTVYTHRSRAKRKIGEAFQKRREGGAGA